MQTRDSKPLFLRQFFNPDIAETYCAMVTLQQDRTRLIHFIIQLSAGWFVALDIVMDFDAVEIGRDAVADDGHLGGPPFASRFGHELVWFLEVIDGAVAAFGRLAVFVVAQDLDFLPASKIKAAI